MVKRNDELASEWRQLMVATLAFSTTIVAKDPSPSTHCKSALGN